MYQIEYQLNYLYMVALYTRQHKSLIRDDFNFSHILIYEPL